jgi:ferrochelatase
MANTNEHLKAVLLLAFGGPESMDEVEPFLRALMEGRQVTDRQIEAVRERYRLIGGGSPLKSITGMQAQGLELALNRSNPSYRAFTGMRYSEPSIEHAVERILALGIRDIVALPLSPYYNSASTGKYIQRLEQAAAGKDLNMKIVKSYNTNPFFIKAIEQTIQVSIKDVDKPFIIFSAHSLPVGTAKQDGYVEQLEQTLKLILDDLSLPEYALAFQSRGMSGGDWLGPDVKDIMDRCAKNNKKNIIVVPYGFVSDHVETLYDIDIVYRRYAGSLGLNFVRTPSLNTSELFIQALEDVVINPQSLFKK